VAAAAAVSGLEAGGCRKCVCDTAPAKHVFVAADEGYNTNQNTAIKRHTGRCVGCSAFAMRRTDSVTGIEDVVNRNTAWLNERGGWLIFVVTLVLVWLVLFAFSLPSYAVWSVLTLSHGFLTLYFMHFRLGSPFGGFFGDDGRYDSLTWWEQIDNGEQNTNNRKFLSIIPLVLLIVTFKVTSDAGAYFCLGSSVFISSILLIAKTPIMYRRRLFGFNRVQTQDAFFEASPRAGGTKSKRT
jgi:hypothetical protein